MSPELAPSPFASARTIVIKVGSAVLTAPGGLIDMTVMGNLCAEIADLIQSGRNVILVTSGAVAAGRGALGIRTRHTTIAEKQALAAIGQSRLMQLYSDFFSEYGIIIGQMLLTRGDMEDRRRYVNISYTLEELLRRKCLPIINENDTVTVDELKFGDNDGLSAMVAVKMQADALILLSDVEGVFDSNPKVNPDAKLLERIERVTPSLVEQLCQKGKGVSPGSGGMESKLMAARMAMTAGVDVAIAPGKRPRKIASIIAGKFRGTYFPAVPRRQTLRRHWILTGRCAGKRLWVDDGARTALVDGKKSLLPAGVRRVEGHFKPGDLVEIADSAGRTIGRGIASYSSTELDRIKGHKSAEIAEILGSKPYDEAVHRDNLVITESEGRTK